MRRLPLWLLTPLLLLSPVGRADAWERSAARGGEGACLFWGSRSTRFVVREPGSRWLSAEEGDLAVRAALDAWSGHLCSDLHFELEGYLTDVEAGYPAMLRSQPQLAGQLFNPHAVLFRGRRCSEVAPADDDCHLPENLDCDVRFHCWSDDIDTGGDVLAVTLVTADVRSGRILDADVVVDESDFEFADLTTNRCSSERDPSHCADLQNALTHEFGHAAGFAHSADVLATMYGQVVVAGETSKRELAQDDIDGLCAVYPRGLRTQTCASLGTLEVNGWGCSSTEGGSGAALLLALSWFGRRRGRP